MSRDQDKTGCPWCYSTGAGGYGGRCPWCKGTGELSGEETDLRDDAYVRNAEARDEVRRYWNE